jgi:hypothetical protein
METLRIREWKVSSFRRAMKDMGELEVTDESNLPLLRETESNLFLNGLRSDPSFSALLRPQDPFRMAFPHSDGRSVANPAPVTILSAGRTRLLPQAFLILLPQKKWLYPSIDEGPRESLFKVLSLCIGLHLHFCRFKSLSPAEIMELVTPTVKSTSQPMRLDQDPREISIPHRKDSFQEAEMRILPFEPEGISL